MEFIDASGAQRYATVEETKLTHIFKCGEFVKIAFRDKIKITDYNKIILLHYDDDDRAVMMAYFHAKNNMFLGEKGEEFDG